MIWDQLTSILEDPNAFWVLCGTVLLGLASGVLGSFAFLRKQGLMGDVLSHATLPGICIAFWITGSKNPLLFLIGATFTGILASIVIQLVTRYSRIKEDTALGLVLSVFFGIGIVFLTQIQHSANGNQSGLDKFLFGQSASLVSTDVWIMGGVALLLVFLSSLFYKELKLLAFDANFGNSIGFPMRWLDFFLMLLLTIAVVIGLQAAGVILMASLLITPAAAARYWTDKLGWMILLSALMGALSGALGTIISSLAYHLSTGPIIVISATILFLISLIFAPKRGLISRYWRFIRMKKRLTEESLLLFYYEIASFHDGSIPTKELHSHASNLSQRELLQITQNLVKSGDLIKTSEESFQFTEKGWKRAYDTLLFQRMIEIWLMFEQQIESDLHAGQIDELVDIPDELKSQLRTLLQNQDLLPTWINLPHLQEKGRAAS
ncbi:metal ABC transporter permease [Risungbinella massiliensis]|uniref:metal ABC transporter permease n=1 Tax=Risungbinella massiliensis TaxID=1329796 RepID=UPI0005CC2E85|nr:metal ABC transporter permease [Risungbinella massiliensis]